MLRMLKGIHFIAGIGHSSNIYVIDDEIVVDSGTGEFFTDIKSYIQKNHDTSRMKMIINTHCHYDHSGGDKKLRDWLNASISIHEKDKRALETGRGIAANLFNIVPKIVTVDKALRNGMKIKTKNYSFEVIHTPGHTPGSICLYEREHKILISGDTLFENGVGRFDLPGGDGAELKKSLEKLSSLPITYLLPGHGQPKTSGVNFHIKQVLLQTNFYNYNSR